MRHGKGEKQKGTETEIQTEIRKDSKVETQTRRGRETQRKVLEIQVTFFNSVFRNRVSSLVFLSKVFYRILLYLAPLNVMNLFVMAVFQVHLPEPM